jgi:hypothetical protein
MLRCDLIRHVGDHNPVKRLQRNVTMFQHESAFVGVQFHNQFRSKGGESFITTVPTTGPRILGPTTMPGNFARSFMPYRSALPGSESVMQATVLPSTITANPMILIRSSSLRLAISNRFIRSFVGSRRGGAPRRELRLRWQRQFRVRLRQFQNSFSTQQQDSIPVGEFGSVRFEVGQRFNQLFPA